MSARRPFFPTSVGPVPEPEQSPPASRATNQEQTNLASTNAPLKLTLESSNPLNASDNSKDASSTSSQLLLLFSAPGASQAPAYTTDANDKSGPLKISGLIARKSQAGVYRNQNHFAPRRPSSDNSSLRPGTSDPHSHQNQNESQTIDSRPHPRLLNRNNRYSPELLAPLPVQATRSNPSALLGNNDLANAFSDAPIFKTPSLPSSNATSQALTDNSSLNDTHIPTSTVEKFTFTKPPAISSTSHDQRSPESSDTLSSASSNPQMSDLQLQIPNSFKLNMALPNQSGPRRVLIKADNSSHSHQSESPTLDQHITKSKFTKRSRAEKDTNGSDDTEDFGPRGKRYKSDREIHKEEEYRQRQYDMRCRSRTRTPSSHPYPSPRAAQMEVEHEQEQDQLQYESSQEYPNTGMHLGNPVHYASGALDRILSRSVDTYVEDHMEAYERAVERWKECSMTEWVKGADEIAVKYGKILEFVKTHMTTKLQLFASFDSKIDAHNDLLSDRAKALAAAKDRLVKEGGNVLGRGVGAGV